MIVLMPELGDFPGIRLTTGTPGVQALSERLLKPTAPPSQLWIGDIEAPYLRNPNAGDFDPLTKGISAAIANGKPIPDKWGLSLARAIAVDPLAQQAHDDILARTLWNFAQAPVLALVEGKWPFATAVASLALDHRLKVVKSRLDYIETGMRFSLEAEGWHWLDPIFERWRRSRG